MAQTQEVVISGIGVVSPIGIGREAFWNSLRQRTSGVCVRPGFETDDTCCRICAPVKDFDPKQYVTPRKALKVMCREIQLGYSAAVLAMQDAGLAAGSVDPDRLGVVTGADVFHCDVHELEEAYRTCFVDGTFHYERWGEHGISRIYPLWMLKHLPNMTACQIGIATDARGHNNSITLEEVSSLLSVIEAARVIQRGAADIMLAGGAGSRMNVTMMALRGAGQMSHRLDEPERASRPFDAGRDGMVAGEGAGIFVLESRSHAESRGAKPLARILSSSSNCDPHIDGSEGIAIRNSLTAALKAAGLRAADVGHVKARGQSTVQHDALEAQAIRDVLGEVPVTAPKSFFGYTAAGSGAIEMAASVLALVHGEVPVTLNYQQPDPRCPVNVVSEQPLTGRPNVALVMSQSDAGQAVTICLAGCD